MKEKFFIFLKGIAMGSADVVPGVSGGTVAFITGIYERLLKAISAVDIEALKLFSKFKFKELWDKLDLGFLLPLFLGIGTAIISLAKLMKYLLENEPIGLWSFFFGLIIASAILVQKQVGKWNIGSIISLIIGTSLSYYITIATPAQSPEGLIYIFLAGMVAICAMILPGISGAFMLLLMGQYHNILDSISNFKLDVIAVFCAGAGIGIVSFARVLTFLLNKFHDITIALLTGFMIGSLNKVWPWKEVVETYTDRHGNIKPLLESNLLPQNFEGDNQLILAIILALVGFLLVIGIEKVADKQSDTLEK
ncbi:DUF368 domain-containing protein [Flammeovirga kamogawensis]|uniref:DUF368 domain-containing protein n=1 Tax=Flammeovirga kamogawensis TaxID=373891 RepID=A0ABX8GTL4_9BACT|nr:DUF368 domain-containing protein [Flammeovirga kamogawensis]MBB6463990.1 putative membrane protein [Flammeovirga kamogawensis]QWG06617.1 DUF368 domain-containing protein [Flammeovirga kamogawensis]